MNDNLEPMLDCTKCGDFTEATGRFDDSKNVVRCAECGKRHSTDSMHMVDPEKYYHRDESGKLLSSTP